MASVATLTGLAVSGARLVVVKRRLVADTVIGEAERRRAHRCAVEATVAEARWLVAAHLRGVVRLHRVRDTELESRLAGTSTLRTVAPALRARPAAGAALVAHVAATVEGLHRIGLVHGRIDLDHTIVAGPGRDRIHLCSPSGATSDSAADIAALGRLAAGLLSIWDRAPPGWESLIDEIADGSDRLRPRQVFDRFARLADRRPPRSLPTLARWR